MARPNIITEDDILKFIEKKTHVIKSRRNIARELNISPSTAKVYLKRLLESQKIIVVDKVGNANIYEVLI